MATPRRIGQPPRWRSGRTWDLERLRLVARALAMAVLAGVLLAAVPAGAQPRAFPSDNDERPESLDLSFLTGAYVFSDWSDAVVLASLRSDGLLQEMVVQDLGVEPDQGFDAILTYWRGRLGFRVHAGFAESCVAISGACLDVDGVGVNAWLFDVGGVWGLRSDEGRQLVRPYVFAGFGAAAYDLDRPLQPALLANRNGAGGPPVVIGQDGSEFLLSLNEIDFETSAALNFGIGTDLRIGVGGGTVGLRIELSDHVSDSPIDLRVTSFEGTFFEPLPDQRLDFGPVHNFRLTTGLVVEFPVR